MTGQRLAVGLCGCGNMGAAIAHRLAGAATLTVFDLVPARSAAVAASTNVEVAADLPALAGVVDHLVLSLPTAAACSSVIAEAVRHLKPGSVIIETSTVNPSDIRASEAACRAAGIALVDAAILSGVAQMRDGSTTLLVGGEPADRAAAEPVLRLMTPDLVWLGPLGSGMAAKVGNNAVSHAVMVVLVEAASMMAAAGVPLDTFADLLSSKDGGLIRPLAHRLRERVFDGWYDGGMPTEAAHKDSVLALALAQQLGVPLFAIQAAHAPYEIALAEGLGREDYAAIAKLWEGWTRRRLRPERE